MVLINVLLAILVDTYTTALKALQDPESLFDQIMRIFKHFWFNAAKTKSSGLQDLFDIMNQFEADDCDGFTLQDLVVKAESKAQIDRFQAFLKPTTERPPDEEVENLRALLAQQAVYRALTEENAALNAQLYRLECQRKEASERASVVSPRDRDRVCFSQRNQLRVFSDDSEEIAQEPRPPCEDGESQMNLGELMAKPEDQPESFLGLPLSSLSLSLQLPSFTFPQPAAGMRSSLFEERGACLAM
eukprot:757507-Hanusia_phi.AAC.2